MSPIARALRVGVVLLSVPAVFVWGVKQSWWTVPPHWDPFAQFSVDHPLTPVTRWKRSRIVGDPEACLAVLRAVPAAELQYLSLADYTPVEDCPLTNVVRIENTGVAFNQTFTARCPFLVSWLMFERQRLQSIALDALGTRVERVDHYGSFACRNVYGSEVGRRSQHAAASALDVAGFRFENGDTAYVRQDWDNPDAPGKAAFLRRTHEAACDYFGTVLGPEYNAAHADHFHFDTANFGACR